ncbi:MAG: exo-beta-1,3-glucanase [Gemmataceae bacterium]|nr:exo-beta-1,3-glucanase [Gemmataceae bacterium]
MSRRVLLAAAVVLAFASAGRAAEPDKRFPLFAYLTGAPAPSMVAYVPSELDPRQDANNRRLATSSLRADLEALRPAFDGLVLYGYHEAATPRIVAVAKELKYRAVLLAIWDPKSAAEQDGVAALARLHEADLALGVIVGNEGVTFKRYEAADLPVAAARLRATLPKTVPLTMSEPLFQYKEAFAREFGDFLAPNIHPVFDQKDLAPAEAAAWARAEAAKLAKAANKPVLVKETGMPHAGTREGKKYSPESQAAFWAAYLKPGRLADGPPWAFYGVAFEAFDVPWKAAESRLEIEASWGLLDPKRKPHPAFDVWTAAK